MSCPNGPHLYDCPVDDPATCSFTEDAGVTICGRPPIWHLLVQPRFHPYAMVYSCTEHLPVAEHAAPILARHRFLPAECGPADHLWSTQDNRCVPKEEAPA